MSTLKGLRRHGRMAGEEMHKEHPITVESREHFDRIAAQYDALYVPNMREYERVHHTILEALSVAHRDDLQVLELGVGTGNLTQRILQRMPRSRVVGYDLSSQMIARAREKLSADGDRVSLVVEDISRADFRGSFDAVVSAITVHHVPQRSKPDLFRRIYRALSPGGFVMIADTFQPASLRLFATYRRMAEAAKQKRMAEAVKQKEGPTRVPKVVREGGSDGDSGAQVFDYLRWMQQAGFRGVDCVFKRYLVAVVYGERPLNAQADCVD